MNNFIKLVRKTYIFNRKAVLLTAGAVLLGCILLGASMGLLGVGGGKAEVICFGLMFLLIATVVASMAFADFKTKTGKISTLMTPATAFEKFAVRWIAVVPLLALLLVAGFYVGDVSRIIANRFSQFYVESPSYIRIVDVSAVITSIFVSYKTLAICGFLTYYFFWQSIYFLGGILWPKLSFIKTFAVNQVASLVLLPVINNLDVNFSHVDLYEALAWIEVLTALLTIGIYWLTYHLMKRNTVA